MSQFMQWVPTHTFSFSQGSGTLISSLGSGHISHAEKSQECASSCQGYRHSCRENRGVPPKSSLTSGCDHLCVCKLDWAMACPEIWTDIISGVFKRVILNKSRIWMEKTEWNKLPSIKWGGLIQSMEDLNRKSEKENLSLVSWAEALIIFSWLQISS